MYSVMKLLAVLWNFEQCHESLTSITKLWTVLWNCEHYHEILKSVFKFLTRHEFLNTVMKL